MATGTNIVTNWYTVDGKIGVDLNNVQTSVGAPAQNPNLVEIPAGRAALGTRVQGNNGSEWLFVAATVTVSANDLVAIDVNYSATPLTTTLASSNVYTYGIAAFQTSVANGGATPDLFWALMKADSGALVNVSATAAKGVQLYIATAQSGAVTSTASGTAVKNIFVNTALTGSTAAVDVVIPGYITVST